MNPHKQATVVDTFIGGNIALLSDGSGIANGSREFTIGETIEPDENVARIGMLDFPRYLFNQLRHVSLSKNGTWDWAERAALTCTVRRSSWPEGSEMLASLGSDTITFYRDGKPYEPTANDKSATNWYRASDDRDTWPPEEE